MMRRSRTNRRLRGYLYAALICGVSIGAPVTAGDTPEGLLRDAEHALVEGRPRQALALLDQHEAGLTAEQRPTAWSIIYGERRIKKVKLGRRYGYVFGELTRSGELTRPHLPISDNQIVASSLLRGQPRSQVTCIDLATGESLWTHEIMYQSRAAVHPGDDALWVWRYKGGVFRVSPGGEAQRHATLDNNSSLDKKINGLRV